MRMILTLVILLSLPAIGAQESRKPIVDAFIRGDNFHTVETLAALIEAADGIVVAKVLSMHDRSRATPVLQNRVHARHRRHLSRLMHNLRMASPFVVLPARLSTRTISFVTNRAGIRS